MGMKAGVDYGALIWVAFFVFSFAISAIEKRYNAKRRQNAEQQPQFPPVAEVFPPIQTLDTPTDSKRAPHQELNTTMHKDSQESLDSLETLGMPESLEKSIARPFTPSHSRKVSKKRKNATKLPTTTVTATAPAPYNETDTQPETEEIAEKFNLRDAVIYSEILKPKFDE